MDFAQQNRAFKFVPRYRLSRIHGSLDQLRVLLAEDDDIVRNLDVAGAETLPSAFVAAQMQTDS